MTQEQLALQSVEKLLELGVREFCVCAGARNALLVHQLNATTGIQVFRFFEERSAAFFALGRARDLAQPVAVVTTSGTAVAECLPAVIEAEAQNLALVVVSADRPKSFRGTRAPQSIEQVGLFGNYVETCWDWDAEQTDFVLVASCKKPLHLNICFEEPGAQPQITPLKAKPLQKTQTSSNSPGTASIAELFRSEIKKLFVIVGPCFERERFSIENFLEKHECFFSAESTAGLQLSAQAQQRQIFFPDRILPKLVRQGEVQSLLRLGEVPTLRFWRDLESTFSDLPVFSWSRTGWSGLARPSFRLPRDWDWSVETVSLTKDQQIKTDDQVLQMHLQSLVHKFPQSEPALLAALKKMISSEASVYLGNSLPVRHWDLLQSLGTSNPIWANRGVNGIDGQISSFLGWQARAAQPSWGIFGDLTALYDLASLWVTSQLQPSLRRVVVVNNFGGQIFSKIPGAQAFLNEHQIRFGFWAQMWGWTHQEIRSPEDWRDSSEKNLIFEILPDLEQTRAFEKAWLQP